MASILVTGATGFVAKSLIPYLSKSGHQVRAALRGSDSPSWLRDVEKMSVGDIDAETDWSQTLQGIDCVIHLAARVHVMKETEANPLDAFRMVNVEGTTRLYQQASQAAVKRFLFLSTIKVNGESTNQSPFQADDPKVPADPYGVSKKEAEDRLLSLAKESDTEVVIIRPPLIYGPGVKGNFLRLAKLVSLSWPLPLGNTENKRSLVYIDNLCSFLTTCVEAPNCGNQVFLVSDGSDLSTTDLFKLMAQGLGKRSFLFSFPASLIHFFARMLGRTSEYDRLFGSLQVSIEKNKELVDWTPPVSPEEGIQATMKWYSGRENEVSFSQR